MLYKTQAIVLHTTDYSDTSLIVKLYTQAHGVQRFLVKGAKRKGASVKSNLFQPLYLLDVVAYKNERNQLQALREVKVSTLLASITSSPQKIAIVFFMNEIMYKCFQEEESNPDLFSFLHESILLLENTEEHFVNLHLIFMLRLSRFLGFYPKGNYSTLNQWFDMQEGLFMGAPPLHAKYLSEESSTLFNQLLLSSYYDMERLVLSRQERKKLLTILIEYYELHLPQIGKIKSQTILQDIFD
jgi:DNA repair protein RecO (recombination protein O)